MITSFNGVCGRKPALSLFILSWAVIAAVFTAQGAYAAAEESPPAEQADPAEAPAQHGLSAESKAAIPEDYNCVNCHVDLEDEVLTPPVNEWMESVHRQVGVKCHDCHGGDPVDEDMAMEPDAGYIGKPEPKDIPDFCAKCHANAKMMRAYNQRTDQYDLYSGSVHGRKLQGGDTEAPSCVSCHGKHKILRPSDPNSMVNRQNIPETCGGCHAKKDVFEKRRKPFNQLALYKKSWHYELFKSGNLLVPTCMDCHGNHGITPPKSERVQTVCFNCHAGQAEYYKSSAHWAVYKKEGEPVCLHCHNNHDVARPSAAKFTGDEDNDCVGCHDENDPAYKTGVQIQSVVMSTTEAVNGAASELKDFNDHAHGGFETSAMVASMEKAQAKLKELNTLTHKLDVNAIKSQSEDMIKTAKNVSETVEQMFDEIKTRKIALMVAWVVFIGFAVSLWQKSKTLENRD